MRLSHVGPARRARLARQFAVAVIAAAATPVFAAPDGRTVPDTTAQRVLACTACHGKEGVSTREGYIPRIAGKPAGYLFNQLLNFRDGRRNNAAMAVLIDNMSEPYLREVADHFATLNLPYQPAPLRSAPAQKLGRGEILVKEGDATLRLPACMQCHGVALTGVAPSTPGLVGLPKDYLLAQLGAWRTGMRRARPPDCMGEISRRLSHEDLSAVATYLSMRPVPRDAAPAAFLPVPLPIPCGGDVR
jgi:cytochrome c553